MATRTSVPPRPRGARADSSPSKRRPDARQARPAARPAPSGPAPLARLVTGLGRGMAAVWLGIGHVLGGTVRHLGRGARELDPAHRRDGLGLALVGLAILVAFSVWWNVTAGLGGFVGSIVTGALGALDWA